MDRAFNPFDIHAGHVEHADERVAAAAGDFRGEAAGYCRGGEFADVACAEPVDGFFEKGITPMGGAATEGGAALAADSHGFVSAGELVVEGFFARDGFDAGLSAGDDGVVCVSDGEDG